MEYDELPNANLFGVDTATPSANSEDDWINEMSHFLSTGLPPENLTLDAKKRLVVRSRNFCLVTHTLYHKGLDGI